MINGNEVMLNILGLGKNIERRAYIFKKYIYEFNIYV